MNSPAFIFLGGLSFLLAALSAGCAEVENTYDAPPPGGGYEGDPRHSDPLTVDDAQAPGTQEAVAPQIWKSYVNEEFRFAFQYPPSLSVVESREVEKSSLQLRVRLVGSESADPLLRDRLPGYFALEVFANPRRLALRDWLDIEGRPFGNQGYSVNSIKIGGVSALDITTERMLAPNRYIYLSTDGFIIRLTPLGPSSDSIMKSFRLL